MRRFDVCNGDADGLCAVLQWRLAHPAPATLVTGLKRDLELLHTVRAQAGDEVLVCDLSMQRNHAALLRLLDAGVQVRYVDHHKVDQVPRHAGLQACIDVDPRLCSSLLMDRLLQGRFRAWALVGAYGDNLAAVADPLAADMGLEEAARQRLRLLGEGINYNAYGVDAGDPHIAPRQLYARLARHAHPLDLLRHDTIGDELDGLRRADLQQALAQDIHAAGSGARWVRLPDAAWARRVIGSFANLLAAGAPAHAHAVLQADLRGGWVVSLRAPQATPGGADEFCRRFGGGGRAGAAGIDHLPADELPRFVTELSAARWCVEPTGAAGSLEPR